MVDRDITQPWPSWFKYLWLLTSPVAVLYLAVRSVRDPIFRSSLQERLYLSAASRAAIRNSSSETHNFARSESARTRRTRPTIWLHAASLGEFQGIRPLLKELRARAPSINLVVTTTSTTGRELARESGLADEVYYLPVDIRWVVRRAIRCISPALMIVAETELWPQLTYELSRQDVPIHIVNGRISDGTVSWYRRLAAIFSPMLQAVSSIDAQTEIDYERYLAVGADSDRLRVSGSTKYDQPIIKLEEDERKMFLRDFCLPLDAIVLTLGSIRPGEEELAIDAALAAQRADPRLALIVAPRHEQRFERVAELLERRNVTFFRRSVDRNVGPAAVLLLDTYGELVRAYSVSDLAFVGGTFISVGGHNPVEPALCGAAVIVGPEVANIRDAVATLRSEGGLFQVHSSQELTQQISLLCSDEVLRFSARDNASRASARYSGLASRLADELLSYLEVRLGRIERVVIRESHAAGGQGAM